MKNHIEFQWGSKLQGTSSEALGGTGYKKADLLTSIFFFQLNYLRWMTSKQNLLHKKKS